MIKAEKLTRHYGGVRALRGIDLEIQGGVFGLLGPNGAGKTTFVRILATLLPPTSGKAAVFGHDVVHDRLPIRKMLGYLPQEFGAYPELTGREYLAYIACLKGIRWPNAEIDRLLAQFGLSGVARRRATSCSGGMLRRLGIAQALLGARRCSW